MVTHCSPKLGDGTENKSPSIETPHSIVHSTTGKRRVIHASGNPMPESEHVPPPTRGFRGNSTAAFGAGSLPSALPPTSATNDSAHPPFAIIPGCWTVNAAHACPRIVAATSPNNAGWCASPSGETIRGGIALFASHSSRSIAAVCPTRGAIEYSFVPMPLLLK